MRQVIAITQVSVDGVMQAPGGPEEDPRFNFSHGGWAMPFFDESAMRVIDDIMAGEFDMLLGRRTYDIFAGYWPHQTGTIAEAFDKATKYVVTHRPDGLGWDRSVPIGGDIVAEIRRLKDSDGPELHVWGSCEVLQTLMGADLVDEHRLWIIPVVLGEGRRLFGDGIPTRALTLTETARTPSGIVFNTYRPAGPVPTA